ncbi:hypothetical protein AAF712_004056 [Marasmius tenuissimus]|uniref:Uncharacterized protein n=1 Tax=Marasmius tenuissimus TaxID=585030 RepID=A0ABR3A863_9AGAR|nr:hypothetical protein PM082_001584 [Marasmius tenuissimus]
MNTLRIPRHFELRNCDAESLSSGNAHTVSEPSSAFLIPFTFSPHNPSDTAILDFLRLDDQKHGSSRYVRCAWLFVALFAKIRDAMMRCHRHNSYLKLAELWREFIWSRREKIFEDVMSTAAQFVDADPWRADRTRSQSQKEAQNAAEALILQICRMTGETPSSRGKIQVLVFFNDASVLGPAEYPIVVTSHLFIHLPIMFLHLTPRKSTFKESLDDSEELQDLGEYFRSEAFVPLPLDMPLEVRSSYLWEFLSGRMLWRAIYYDTYPDESLGRTPVSGPIGIPKSRGDIEMFAPPAEDDSDGTPPCEQLRHISLRSPPPADFANSEDMLVDDDEEDDEEDETLSPPPYGGEEVKMSNMITDDERWLQQMAHSLDDCVTRFQHTPIRLLDLLELFFGPEEMTELSKATVTELPMFGFTFRNAWVHLARILRADETSDKESLGTQLDTALSQRVALADSRRRIYIPVFSASSSAQAVRHGIATSAVVISFGDTCEDVDFGSLPDLLPLLVVQFPKVASPTATTKLGTIRTSANGAFGYQITASGC